MPLPIQEKASTAGIYVPEKGRKTRSREFEADVSYKTQNKEFQSREGPPVEGIMDGLFVWQKFVSTLLLRQRGGSRVNEKIYISHGHTPFSGLELARGGNIKRDSTTLHCVNARKRGPGREMEEGRIPREKRGTDK